MGRRVEATAGALIALGVLACTKGAPSPVEAPSAPAAQGEAGAPSHDDGDGRAASGPSEAPKRVAPKVKNVLVLSIDSMRADMPWDGYPRDIAPTLTRLAAKAVRYRHGYAVSSYTSMSLGGFLGGRYPSELARSGYFFGRYPDKNLFFPELLQKAGVFTASAHAHGYFANAGFEQGFDTWQIVPNLKWNAQTDENVTGPEHEALAERLLSDARTKSGRFFAWFHFLDPHDQYMAHEKDGIAPYGKSLRDRYDAEIAFTDRQIERLLRFVEAQPWAQDTALVITSDHGEAFGEHGQFRHGFTVWETLVRVPLMFVLPGVAPRVIDEPRSAIDLAPTFLELFDLPPEPTFRGTSLVAELYGGEAPPRDVLVDLPATSNNGASRALIRGREKLIVTAGTARRAYDLAADPGEERPESRGERVDALYARYKELVGKLEEIEPYQCRRECLDGGYAKK